MTTDKKYSTEKVPDTLNTMKRRRQRSRSSVLAGGEPMIWLTGGSMLVCLLMVVSLLAMVAWLGMRTFWPVEVVQIKTTDGHVYLGEITRTESYDITYDDYFSLSQIEQQAIGQQLHQALQTKIASLIQNKTLDSTIATFNNKIRDSIDRSVKQSHRFIEATTQDKTRLLGQIATQLDKDLPAIIQQFQQQITQAAQADTTGKALLKYWRNQQVEPHLETILHHANASKHLRQVWSNYAMNHLSQEIIYTAHRRLLRTGNSRLAGTHFTWVSDHTIASQTQPNWAMVIERTEWGRFYGLPKLFSLKTNRPISNTEKQLATLAQYFDDNSYLLNEDNNQTTENLAKQIHNALSAERQKQTAQWIKPFYAMRDNPDKTILAIVNNQPKPLNQLSTGEPISQIVEQWQNTQKVWTQYKRYHDDILELNDKELSLRKHDIGKISFTQEKARLAVRQAEIDYHIELVTAADETLTLKQDLAHLLQTSEQAQQIILIATQQFGANSSIHATATQLLNKHQTQLAKQINTAKLQVEQSMAVFQDVPYSAMQVLNHYWQTELSTRDQSEKINQKIQNIASEKQRYVLTMNALVNQNNANASEHSNAYQVTKTPVELSLGHIVRAYPANQLSFTNKLGVYASRWGEFVSDDPREANMEGGVFPAIFGTVLLTLLLAIIVVPFGVLAALYLREYANAGLIVSMIRIAINNLAGVPSIVFGVFGFGFFCYMVGGYIDGGPVGAGFAVLPKAQWFMWLGVLAGVSVTAAIMVLMSTTKPGQPASKIKLTLRYTSGVTWVVCAISAVVLVAVTPFFDGFYVASLPNPTFGKSGLIWASLTLALLTLPVVIVATEEALSSVPNSMREGSYGCGASKWQTIKRIVLPRAMPGIMTGMILAMARGAGEVAPLMLVGAVKYAPELPFSLHPPFGLNRSFYHLGFQIYDVGFHSPNAEAAKPMVYTTTLLLITIIAALNLAAIALRARLKKKFVGSDF